jgi:hypothetical protein
MAQTRKILILGASYGSLLGIKLLLAGHAVHLVCLPAEAELVNSEGILVRMPVKGRSGLVDVASENLPGMLSASGADGVDPSGFDLVALAMQEPQYGAPGVKALLAAVGGAAVPCMSIMNMPPLTFLRRIPGVDADACRDCYTDASAWEGFTAERMTLCSPDPQAFRPADRKANVLQVRLPTNFKAARFDSDRDTGMLRQLGADIEAARFSDAELAQIELPVKLKVHDSVFVPLAKWPMLVAGNYRCVQKDKAVSIRDAVHADLEASRAVYAWVAGVCKALGATEDDLVPFEKYANAARSLESPSSAARALFAGATQIERLDRLVQWIAGQHGMRSDVLDATVALVNARLAQNRAGPAAG